LWWYSFDKGKTLSYGNLNEIKENYTKQKVIYYDNKIKHEKYVLKTEVEEYISNLKEKGITDIEKLQMSLNDIFIDKVGADKW